ncbi:MAG TPA: DNA polymerase/3'-5' exonuclease PolX [Gemmatimonadales bacterium]|nr:DNA polymerase/3'-5' exonuclease PolX [Gemmatimonadales bacterium]
MENAEIARLFREMADLLEIEGANPFRVRAYRTASRTADTHPESLAEMARHHPDQLTELPGIGEDLAQKIEEIVRTGKLAALKEVSRRTPTGLLELMRLPGLGPKKAKVLFDRLGVRNRSDLSRALKAGKVGKLRGFGPKTEARLGEALAAPREAERRMPLPTATQYGEALLEWIKEAPGIGQAEIAGSFRRRKDTVGDLDILVTAHDSGPVIKRFLAYPERAETLAEGTTRAAMRLNAGLQVDMRVLERESYGAGLYYFTGSKAHNIALRRLGQERGLKINEYGVWRGEKRVAGRTEKEVVEALGLPVIPPELREDRGEIAAAQAGKLPKLVELKQIRGDLQTHTTSSDGRDTLAQMAKAAGERGYQYFAITDHTPAVRVAGGLDSAGFRRQRAAIDHWNQAAHPPTLLAGAEVDILPDGSLDLDDETLAALDLVVISTHSALTLSRREQTRRLVRALQHPSVDILGHPTARLLGKRPPIQADFEEVFRVAADHGVIIEVNGQPERLDPDDVLIQAALGHGLQLAISTDAHGTEELGFMRWGVDQARRGWATAASVVNTRPLPALLALLHQKRAGGRKGTSKRKKRVLREVGP